MVTAATPQYVQQMSLIPLQFQYHSHRSVMGKLSSSPSTAECLLLSPVSQGIEPVHTQLGDTKPFTLVDTPPDITKRHSVHQVKRSTLSPASTNSHGHNIAQIHDTISYLPCLLSSVEISHIFYHLVSDTLSIPSLLEVYITMFHVNAQVWLEINHCKMMGSKDQKIPQNPFHGNKILLSQSTTLLSWIISNI